MKILMINPILYTAENDNIPKVDSIKDTMIYTLCMGFIQNGDKPVLIAGSSFKPMKEEVYPFQVIWMKCKLPQLFKPRCFPLLAGLGNYIREHKDEYDLIISSEVFSLFSLCAVLNSRKKTVIWHELGAHNNMLKKIPSRIWYHIVPRLFMHNTLIIPRSSQARQFIQKYFDNVSEEMIDHGVNINEIGYSLKKDNKFIVVSQLIERKRIDEIIEKFAEFILEQEELYTLEIIGDGILRKNLSEQARQLGIEKNVIFHGKLSHEKISPILQKSKAMLVNTEKDNSMVSIVESIAAGTPIITTSVPFNSYYIRREQLGIVYDNWNKAEMNLICRNNEFYVKNCIRYRKKLSNAYCAKQFKTIVEGVYGGRR